MKSIVATIVASVLLLLSCGNQTRPDSGFIVPADSAGISACDSDTLLELTQAQADSLEFRLLHHYTNNFNFLVKADTLRLVPRGDELSDTCFVGAGDIVAVASIKQSADTVWLKVAHSQAVMGWLTEDELLQSATPNDLISQIIDFLAHSRAFWMSALVLLGLACFLFRCRTRKPLHIFRFSEMDSFYPILFLILAAVLACFYASIQIYAPEFWQEYYFHPTLNPLLLPPVMAWLLTTAWLLVIVFVAVVIDVYNHFNAIPGLAYIFQILGAAMTSYLVIGWMTNLQVTQFPILNSSFSISLTAAFTAFLLWTYFARIRCRFICGACGRKIRKKGRCPHCGMENE